MNEIEVVNTSDDYVDCEKCPLRKTGQLCDDCPYEKE